MNDKDIIDNNGKVITDIEENKYKPYFHSARIMDPPAGAYCSCCRKEKDSVAMFIYQNGNDMTTRNYMALCKECIDGIKFCNPYRPKNILEDSYE